MFVIPLLLQADVSSFLISVPVTSLCLVFFFFFLHFLKGFLVHIPVQMFSCGLFFLPRCTLSRLSLRLLQAVRGSPAAPWFSGRHAVGSQASSATLSSTYYFLFFFLLLLLPGAERRGRGVVLMSANSTPTFGPTCNYRRVYPYLKHYLTRKICQ